MRQAGATPLHVDLRRHLRENDEDRDLTRLICEIADASKYIVNAIPFRSDHPQAPAPLGSGGLHRLRGER